MGSQRNLELVNQSKVLHLLGMGLNCIPTLVLRSTSLVRLDLAYNQLPAVPASIASLTNLEHLWLQGNPIKSVHADIQHCTRLKVLDLRDTALRKLPREMGRLPRILEIDLRGAPLKAKMKRFQRDTVPLMEYLREQDARKQIKTDLFNKLSASLYREVVDSPTGRHNLPLVKAVCRSFADIKELTQVARHCDRLFPPDLAGTSDNPQAAAARVWRKFTALRKKIERKRLASELELKMRAVYYDVIDPAAVEGYIAFIYRQQVKPLEDIQFIVRRASKILPPNPEDITGEGVERSMLALQKEMTDERQRCVDGLFEALRHLYSDQESSKVLALAQKVAAVSGRGKRFAEGNELEELKHLRADAERFFPSEIQEVEPIRVRTLFVS
ncbi:unnamed protein product, partial [Ascophyllum nodosum]